MNISGLSLIKNYCKDIFVWTQNKNVSSLHLSAKMEKTKSVKLSLTPHDICTSLSKIKSIIIDLVLNKVFHSSCFELGD